VSFAINVRVYWEDTDAAGIVYYANYLRFFERARSDWLRQRGVDQQALKSSGTGIFVVHKVDLTYHSPARLDDLLCITAHNQAIRGATLHIAQQVWRLDVLTGERTELLVSANVKVAWVNPVHLKPAKIPASLQTALQAYP
jgi:acyl-CoA thioester hydrolase